MNNDYSYIYAMTNKSMPGLVKIGRSDKPEKRAVQLSRNSSCPTPFDVAIKIKVLKKRVANCEQLIHQLVSDFRVNEGREFFRMPLKSVAFAFYDALNTPNAVSGKSEFVGIGFRHTTFLYGIPIDKRTYSFSLILPAVSIFTLLSFNFSLSPELLFILGVFGVNVCAYRNYVQRPKLKKVFFYGRRERTLI